MTRRLDLWILAAIAAATALSCGFHLPTPSEPAVTTPDSLKIDSVFPLPGTKLVPGTTVVFGAVLSYQVHESDGGGIVAQLGDQNNNPLDSLFPSTVVPRGAGSVAMTSRYQIPASGVTRLNVDYLMLATPGFTTEIAAATTQASYPVGR